MDPARAGKSMALALVPGSLREELIINGVELIDLLSAQSLKMPPLQLEKVDRQAYPRPAETPIHTASVADLPAKP
ncbi:hypothetical protein N7513_000893 [Penicillium frequentans]|nr:hypothetical protein N7513_000893 [Penicillium glabrum]